MVQLTIDFMVGERRNQYLYMRWSGRDSPEQFPVMKDEKCGDFSYGFLNKLLHLPVIICGVCKKRRDKLLVELPYEGEKPEYSNIHFLKSHLQKCIRLKKTELAIKTAVHLLELDPVQFLRRLAIIFVEDVMITKHYSTIVWLLIAVSSKKIMLQLHHKEWLLGIVYIAAECKFRDKYDLPTEVEKLSNEKLAKIIHQEVFHLQDYHQKAVIMCLIHRAAFGGMNGDVHMLLRAAYVWSKRFQSPEERWMTYYNQDVRTISASVLPLEKNEWVLSAVDFHCFPKMLQWITEREEIDEQTLKHIIWHFSSKTNYRNYYTGGKQTVPKDSKNLWDKYKNQVLSIAKYAINHYA